MQAALASFAYLLCFERLPVGIGDMKTETQQAPCQQVDACQNLGVLEAPASRAADPNMRRMLTRRPLRFTSLQWLCGLERAIRHSLPQPPTYLRNIQTGKVRKNLNSPKNS